MLWNLKEKLEPLFSLWPSLWEAQGKAHLRVPRNRGVYLWTNNKTGHQYNGSAVNLSSRLSDYFTDSYLKLQVTRGSVISSAIIKHGHSNFSLQV
jgi:hypothetical protein